MHCSSPRSAATDTHANTLNQWKRYFPSYINSNNRNKQQQSSWFNLSDTILDKSRIEFLPLSSHTTGCGHHLQSKRKMLDFLNFLVISSFFLRFIDFIGFAEALVCISIGAWVEHPYATWPADQKPLALTLQRASFAIKLALSLNLGVCAFFLWRLEFWLRTNIRRYFFQKFGSYVSNATVSDGNEFSFLTG